MVDVQHYTLVETAAHRWSSSYPVRRQFQFSLTLEPVGDTPQAAIVGLKVVMVDEELAEGTAPPPTTYDSTIKYLAQLSEAFAPSVAPSLAEALWGRLREDTVRLARQFDVQGIPLPSTAAPLIQRGATP